VTGGNFPTCTVDKEARETLAGLGTTTRCCVNSSRSSFTSLKRTSSLPPSYTPFIPSLIPHHILVFPPSLLSLAPPHLHTPPAIIRPSPCDILSYWSFHIGPFTSLALLSERASPHIPIDMASQGARDLVYCHSCQEEWYRDEHGIVCPGCHSDFTEIVRGESAHLKSARYASSFTDRFCLQIELDHDPRAHLNNIPGLFPSHPFLDPRAHHQSPQDGAPDPDEDDINHLHWHETGPNSFTVRGSLRQTHSGPAQDGDGRQPPPSAPPANDAAGFVGNFLSMIQSLTGPGQPPQGQGPRQMRTEFLGGHATVTYNTTISLHPRNHDGPQSHDPPEEELNP
jgi:hypothetical protein